MDALRENLPRALAGPRHPRAPAPGAYYLATVHRQENVDDADRLSGILEALEALPVADGVPGAPPHARGGWPPFGLAGSPRVRLVAPQPYLAMLRLVKEADAVLTDSGGLQKEAFILGTPCVTLRDTHRVDGDGGERRQPARGGRSPEDPLPRCGACGAGGRAGARPASTATGAPRSASPRSSGASWLRAPMRASTASGQARREQVRLRALQRRGVGESARERRWTTRPRCAPSRRPPGCPRRRPRVPAGPSIRSRASSSASGCGFLFVVSGPQTTTAKSAVEAVRGQLAAPRARGRRWSPGPRRGRPRPGGSTASRAPCIRGIVRRQ